MKDYWIFRWFRRCPVCEERFCPVFSAGLENSPSLAVLTMHRGASKGTGWTFIGPVDGGSA